MIIQMQDTPKINGKVFCEIPPGTVFSWSDHRYLFLKVTGGAVNLNLNMMLNTVAFMSTLYNYQEYPQARLVVD